MDVYVNSRIDPVVKRCIAKMVFNYLARVTGRTFVLLPAFNPIRAYIRHGTSPGYLLVDADDTPILANDQRLTTGSILELTYTSISPSLRVTARIGTTALWLHPKLGARPEWVDFYAKCSQFTVT